MKERLNELLDLRARLAGTKQLRSKDDAAILPTTDFYSSFSWLPFGHELVDPKGFLRSWNNSGIGACSGGLAGIKCARRLVIVIQLPWKGLGGRVTEKIGQLQALRKLSLHDNAIGGAIPSSLGLLPNLRGVQLFNNRFSGSIPPTLGLSPLLQSLDFCNNSLSGTIPATLAISTRLFRLNFSYNSLSGSIPTSLTQSQSLIFLALEHNNLSGSIPDSWGGNVKALYQLQSLTLGHNSFSGTIPASLGNLSELQEISLSHNNMAGLIPNEIGRLSRLRTLDFSYNALNGSLPAALSNLSNLVVLNLESYHLDHQIPAAVNKLQKLSVLNLRNNQFAGPIPATVGNISFLTQVDLSQNKFSGEIPASIGDLPNLSSFNVSYNNLSGPVPTKLAQKFNASAFVGNLELCGYSALTQCPIPPSPGPSTPPESPAKKHHKLSTKDIILIAAGALLISGEKGTPPTAGEVEAAGEAGGKIVHFDGPMVFTADDLLCATAEIMGKSTYGTVYKATLEDGSVAAVKRLREKITKGQREFETEVNILGKIRHPNLLAMRAYYLGPKGEKLLLFNFHPFAFWCSFLLDN
ncbi:probable leucine-rich repeat receptor-like protein kinase IMK3 [Coffea arabica]|uniref:Probable leucine-rich repeat receptor-like protein kinase IMK3 n=1 Tax=Coffea arabica TaxID=13443 RepID=A0ABM4VEE4_COFAR